MVQSDWSKYRMDISLKLGKICISSALSNNLPLNLWAATGCMMIMMNERNNSKQLLIKSTQLSAIEVKY